MSRLHVSDGRTECRLIERTYGHEERVTVIEADAKIWNTVEQIGKLHQTI